MIFGSLFDEPLFLQIFKEILSCFDVTGPGGAAVVVEGKLEFFEKSSIDFMKLIDMSFGRALSEIGAQRDGDAMLVGAANVGDLFAHEPLKTGVAVPRQISPCDVAKV